MILEIGLCAFLVGSLVLLLLSGRKVSTRLPTELRSQLRRQKVFTVQEAEVWLTCVQKARALDAPKHTSTPPLAS
jgi:hypothetical protein